ncbi:MAG: VanW family protein [Acutalibacteraceae bacterium]
MIRRRLGNVDMQLQENKAVNLALAAPCVDRVLIRPGEEFSFWRLVGNPTAERGFRDGLVIAGGKTGSGIGGGMCQFTNLIHWMVLHSELTITEHHQHDGLDLFPDYGRKIPFGTGTSILYNYLDYRFRNDTRRTYQLTIWLDEEYLHGELLADVPQDFSFHIECRDEFFSREEDGVYRNNEIWRHKIDVHTGREVGAELLRKNHARLAYDPAGLTLVDLRGRTGGEE